MKTVPAGTQVANMEVHPTSMITIGHEPTKTRNTDTGLR
jgi:hypothetical protein